MEQEIWEALESTAPNRDSKLVDPRANPNNRDIELYKKSLLKFLSELDASLSVGEVVEALENYHGE